MSESLPFGRVFQDRNGSQEKFPGFLLVNFGREDTADERALAANYGLMTLNAVDFALERLDEPEAGYPALYLGRHTLELYLKGLVPDWEERREKGKTRHHIDYLIDILRNRLAKRYDVEEILALSEFLHQIALLDPKSMAFRFRDGAKASFGETPIEDPEIWVDFVALSGSLRLIFEALNDLWIDKNRITR